jgi:hypothetical protein
MDKNNFSNSDRKVDGLKDVKVVLRIAKSNKKVSGIVFYYKHLQPALIHLLLQRFKPTLKQMKLYNNSK